MQVILDSLDSSFARPGSAPLGGGKKGEFRDWTSHLLTALCNGRERSGNDIMTRTPAFQRFLQNKSNAMRNESVQFTC